MNEREKTCCKTLAENIRARARRKGLSIERLADHAGVSRTGLWDVLRGDRLPTVRWLLRIADALECRVSQLLP